MLVCVFYDSCLSLHLHCGRAINVKSVSQTMFIRIYTLLSPFSRKYTKTGEMADAGSGHQGGDTEFEDQDLEAVAGPDTSSGLSDTPLALDQVIKGWKA